MKKRRLRIFVSCALVLSWLLFLRPVSVGAADPSCTCPSARLTNGWCETHEIGSVGGVLIRSKIIYEVLDAHGHELDLTTFKCPACRKAIEQHGFCSEHRVGFVRGLTYFSRLTYELARARTENPDGIRCAICRKNARNHGWCNRCRIGRAGAFAIRDRPSYDRVAEAIGILEFANREAPRCQGCAIAILTDSSCPIHRIPYRNGHAAGKSSSEAAASTASPPSSSAR